MSLKTEQILDVTLLEPRMKHPTIFSHFDNLQEGESFILANDHDPQPLFYQLLELRGDIFTWDYLEQGPQWWRIRIAKKHHEAQVAAASVNGDENVLNVTLLEPRLKHATIFARYNALKPGESLFIHNDHDPKPLYYQLMNEHGTTFTWDYQEQGPEWWKIKITKKGVVEQEPPTGISTGEDNILNVTLLEPRVKHATIFARFDALRPGESLYIHNDHDPRPLYFQLVNMHGNTFEWEYQEQGPIWWKIKITRQEDPNAAPANEAGENILNVTLLEPRMKHPTIFKRFDELKEGESLTILNDHDPKPLYYQLLAERGNIFFWEYLQSGPQWWRIKIKKRIVNEGEETIGQIVAQDYRKAQVFKKYQFNYAIDGRKTLKDACYEKELDEKMVEQELRDIDRGNLERGVPFNEWQPHFLMDYIINTHHTYINKNLPELKAITAKVQGVHAGDHPELNKVNQLINYISSELLAHLQKEERIVFPYFKNIAEAYENRKPLAENPFGTANVPINLMEMEHESVFANLAEIRNLTNNYKLPEDACDSYNILFKMIQEFENDLLLHVHLENNILFPMMIEKDKAINV